MSKPDTNQASLFELCKNVYEKTGWEAPETYKAEDGNPENDWQAYDTDYLLEKLPEWTELKKKTTISYTAKIDALVSYSFESDTPLKSLLKLTIALSEAGELK